MSASIRPPNLPSKGSRANKHTAWALAIAGLVVVILGGLAISRVHFSGTSDAELTLLARAVPVPAGVTPMPPDAHQTITNGLLTHYRLVNLFYRTTLSCQDLLSDWRSLLQANNRRFTQTVAAVTNLVTLNLTDTSVQVSIVLDGDPANPQTQCGKPFVGAWGSTYHS